MLFLVLLLRIRVREWCILYSLAISGDSPIMWIVLGALGHGVLKIVKGILYISRHGQVHMFFFIIPFNSDASVYSTSPIF
jgi:hypothetical protein